jgi:hypothetical protein
MPTEESIEPGSVLQQFVLLLKGKNALAGNVAKFGVHHAPFVTALGNTRTSA